jgi:hypothetical protein
MKSGLMKKTHMLLPCGECRVASVEFEPETRNPKPETRHRASSSRLALRASRLLLFLFALVILGAAPAKKEIKKDIKDPKIAVSTHLDRTAIWVGDTLRYTVRAVHDPDVEVVLDSLKKDGLNLAPFVVRDISVRRDAYGGNKKVTDISLQLATYESGQAEVRIPSFVLYYFIHRPGADKGGDALAQSVSVPATRVGLRSTLVPDARRLRDTREMLPAGPERWMTAFALGLAGMAFLGVQTARRFWRAPATEKPRTRRRSRRARGRALHDFLRASESMGRDSAEDQLRYYGELSRFVREYLGQSLEIDASSMTPDELAGVLESRGKSHLAAPIKSLLERCEQVLYTRQGAALGSQWRDQVQNDLGRLAQGLRM